MKSLNLPEEKSFTGTALLSKRIAAFVIDLLILIFLVLSPLVGLLGKIVPEGASFSESYSIAANASNSGYILSIYVSSSILIIMYFYFLERKMGQTIGKKLMNIYVVSEKGEIARWQVLVRSIMFVPMFPFNAIIFVDPLVMMFSKTNQRLSERLSKTMVVERYRLD